MQISRVSHQSGGEKPTSTPTLFPTPGYYVIPRWDTTTLHLPLGLPSSVSVPKGSPEADLPLRLRALHGLGSESESTA